MSQYVVTKYAVYVDHPTGPLHQREFEFKTDTKHRAHDDAYSYARELKALNYGGMIVIIGLTTMITVFVDETKGQVL